MKGHIQPQHIAVNKYQLIIVGLPPITVTKIGSLEEKLDTVTLPDRTVASGGNTGPSETTIMVPLHHTVEIAALELWFLQGQDPVSPLYKKNCSLVVESISLTGPTRTYSLNGVFITGRKLPDLEMKNDGDMAENEYTLSIDQILPS